MTSRAKTEADIVDEVRDLLVVNWPKELISREREIAPGRIYKMGDTFTRGAPLRPDFVLFYKPNIKIATERPLAVIEVKKAGDPNKGIQQAKQYAKLMNLNFAYATNGQRIVEYDFTTGKQGEIKEFPNPEELWQRSQKAKPFKEEDLPMLFQPYNRELRNTDLSVKIPRYYQVAAIEGAIDVIARGQKRILITMATGTGKTFVALQIVWKLWKPKKTKPRILYLVDRKFLMEQAEDVFDKPFKKAISRIKEKGAGEVVKSKDVYFSLYQGINDRKEAEGLYKRFSPGFFDYVIIDECHRGSAKDDGNWRAILDYFKSATHIGMTATPKSKANINTYRYFGRPVYTYTLRQGVDDGFLSPYSVVRVTSNVDVTGWRPKPGQKDKFGKEIPDKLYELPHFDRNITLEPRVQFVAAHLINYLKKTNIYDKTLVFCQDQQHALDMQVGINNLKPVNHPDYCVRIVSEEKENVKTEFKDKFSDPESRFPVVVTTSRLLSTGIDIPTLKNIVIDKNINDMVEFKQTVGRGTRTNLTEKPFQQKYWFTIIDHRGASKHFNDPKFDGEPDELTIENWLKEGVKRKVKTFRKAGTDVTRREKTTERPIATGFEVAEAGKSYYKLDEQGNRLQLYRLEDYAKENIRKLYPDKMELYRLLKEPEKRKHFLTELSKIGIDPKEMQEITNNADKDAFEVLVYIAYGDNVVPRRDKVNRIRNQSRLFAGYKEKARKVLDLILDLYAEQGYTELENPREILSMPQARQIGSLKEIVNDFGGIEQYDKAVLSLISAIYER